MSRPAPVRRRWRRLALAAIAFVVALAAGSTIAAVSGEKRAQRAGGAGSGPTSASAATPAPSIVWAVGDGADGSTAGRSVGRLIASANPDKVLYLGDVYDRGTRADFARNYDPLFGMVRGRTSATPGNHEWPQRSEGYLPYWQSVTGQPKPDTYAFHAGGWELLSLNSQNLSASRVRWLHNWLAGRGGTCRLAFWHRPRYSAGPHGDQTDLAPVWRELRGHAALVVNGHEHNMQELRVRDGIRELIAGAGGHGHYSLHAGDPRLAWSNSTRYGALRLRLAPGRADYAFVAADGTVLRRGMTTCR